MPLQGTFDVLDFSEVLHLLARHEMTGRLLVRHRSYGANLFVEHGLLTGADQSEHQPAANTGDVTGRIEEVCFEMLEVERGSFEFHPGKPSTLPVSTRLAVDGVLEQAGQRLAEWHELQEIIPSLDLQPRLVAELSTASVTLDQEHWRLLTSIDGRRSLRAIGRTVNLADFDVCRLTRALLENGVVELDGLAALASVSAEIPVVPARELREPLHAASDAGAEGGAAPERADEEAVTTIMPVVTIPAPLHRAEETASDTESDEPDGSEAPSAIGPSDVAAEDEPTGPRRRLVRIRSHTRPESSASS